jgi:hypothetical protein
MYVCMSVYVCMYVRSCAPVTVPLSFGRCKSVAAIGVSLYVRLVPVYMRSYPITRISQRRLSIIDSCRNLRMGRLVYGLYGYQ